MNRGETKEKQKAKKCNETIPRQPTKKRKKENQFEKPEQNFSAMLLLITY